MVRQRKMLYRETYRPSHNSRFMKIQSMGSGSKGTNSASGKPRSHSYCDRKA